MYKTNIDCSFIQGMVEKLSVPSFIQGMVEIIGTLSKTQPWPTIHLGPTGLGE